MRIRISYFVSCFCLPGLFLLCVLGDDLLLDMGVAISQWLSDIE
ncbi:MAG: hypothetical protein NTX52_08220 [Planctomycetota bacterium]|nr:hypothetical protein [Planctomycetota bacterium]